MVERGDEQSGVGYLLKPVIRATSEGITGNIAGVVEPVDSESFIYAINNSGSEPDTLSSTKANDTDGYFKLVGLEAGTYTVSVDPTSENHLSKDTTGVEVTVGETNELGTITLSQN